MTYERLRKELHLQLFHRNRKPRACLSDPDLICAEVARKQCLHSPNRFCLRQFCEHAYFLCNGMFIAVRLAF